MAKSRKVVRYRRPFHLNIGLIIFGIIFIYMMFYIFSYFTTKHTSVYEVIYGTIVVNNSYRGLALRNEEIVQTEHSGDINYYIKDASKAGVGDLVYSVDSDGAIASQINSANENADSLNPESLDKLEVKISEYSNSYRSNAFYEVYTFQDDLNSELSEVLSTGALNSIADAVTAAEGNSTFYKGTAVKDGVVVYYTDGFEDVTAENFTAEMFDESKYKKVNLKERKKIEAGEAAYKLITDDNWNLILPVSADTARQLQDASTVSIRFKKDGTTIRVPFSQIEKEGEIYLILDLPHSMVRFATDRFVEVEILFDEEKGLKIPNSAIASKDFFTIPMEYFQKGNNSDEEGVMVRRTDKRGKTTDEFVAATVYFTTEYAHYVDNEYLSDGDVILKPNSKETYTIHETAKLDGVYCINKGYAVFRHIDVIYQNEEYSIIRHGTDYGISLYDHIALDGSTIIENAVVNSQ